MSIRTYTYEPEIKEFWVYELDGKVIAEEITAFKTDNRQKFTFENWIKIINLINGLGKITDK